MPSETIQRVMRESVLRDAQAWWNTGRHMYVRSRDVERTMKIKERRQADELFASQNESAGLSLRRFYEEQYQRYGGDPRDLPWDVVTEEDS